MKALGHKSKGPSRGTTGGGTTQQKTHPVVGKISDKHEENGILGPKPRNKGNEKGRVLREVH